MKPYERFERPTAIFSQKLCFNYHGQEYGDISFCDLLIKELKSGDLVLDIGCGRFPYTTLKIAKERPDVCILGIDPELSIDLVKTEDYENASFLNKTYEEFFDKPKMEIPDLYWRIVKDSINLRVEVLGIRVCNHFKTNGFPLKLATFLDESSFLVDMGDPTPGSIFATKRKPKPDPIDEIIAERYGPQALRYDTFF